MEGFDRRKFLKGSSVAAGLAGAMTVVPGALPAFAHSTKGSSALTTHMSREEAAKVDESIKSGAPVVAHIRDAKTGQIDLFVGTEHFSVQDRGLANRILNSAR
jgi:hypothetical protein